MQLILGTQSPKRKEILSQFSIPFTQEVSSFDEDSIPFQGDPDKYVCAISQGKAEALSRRFPEAIILTADTTIFEGGAVYGKPKNEEEACRSLLKLSGKWHTVHTGVTVRQGDRALTQAESSGVLFNAFTEEQIRTYLTKVKWEDKAGGYTVQMPGGFIVQKIDGCFHNILGLPINTAASLLKQFGIDLWKYL